MHITEKGADGAGSRQVAAGGNWKTAHTTTNLDAEQFAKQVGNASSAVPKNDRASNGNHAKPTPRYRTRRLVAGKQAAHAKSRAYETSSFTRLLTCSVATIALGAVIFSLSGFAAAHAKPLHKAGYSIVTGQSTSPLAASAVMPYEGHISFASWCDDYDDGVKMLTTMQNGIEAAAESGQAYLSEETGKSISETSQRIESAGTLSEVETVFAHLDGLADTVDQEVADGIAAEQAAAERERRRAMVVDSLNPDGWSDEKLDFVVSWGERIDAYLSGRTLHGYGQNFAAAAYDYNVDPRIGAAISVIESGGGDVCFLPHNGWGWGSSSWDSWPEAIDGWTASFQRGYGYDMDYADCRAYCPPNAGYYDKLRGQMESI